LTIKLHTTCYSIYLACGAHPKETDPYETTKENSIGCHNNIQLPIR